METRPIAIAIRSKKLGILIKSARQATDRSAEDCALALGISTETFLAFEQGVSSPSLPELEALAYFLKVPLDYFWGRETVTSFLTEPSKVDAQRLMLLRNRFIGACIRQARQEAGLTTPELEERAGIPTGKMDIYEMGEIAIPLPELEQLTTALNRPIKDFQDSRGPIGSWIKQQRVIQHFSELSPELQDFISKPINRPYLDLAYRLSEMSVDKLRAVAEGLLEITL